jgi:hypothetical protein
MGGRAMEMAAEGMKLARKWREQKKITVGDYEEMREALTVSKRLGRKRRGGI